MLMISGAGDGLEIYDFRWLPGGAPRLRAHDRVGPFGCSAAPIPTAKQSAGAHTTQDTKYKNKHAGIKGYEKTGMQITKRRKIKAAI